MNQPLDVLKAYWKHNAFRPTQEEIIQTILRGEDTFALLPTGGGKSICFQVPAMMNDGLCLVISPLIALMQDQVAQLRRRGISAVAIYAGMHRNQIGLRGEQGHRLKITDRIVRHFSLEIGHDRERGLAGDEQVVSQQLCRRRASAGDGLQGADHQ